MHDRHTSHTEQTREEPGTRPLRDEFENNVVVIFFFIFIENNSIDLHVSITSVPFLVLSLVASHHFDSQPHIPCKRLARSPLLAQSKVLALPLARLRHRKVSHKGSPNTM